MAGSEDDGNALQRNKGSRNLCGQDLALLWVFLLPDYFPGLQPPTKPLYTGLPPACLQRAAVFVCDSGNPSFFCAGYPEQCDGPHMA